MKPRRDMLLIGGLFLALILFVVFGPASQPAQQSGGPTSYSSESGGALALYTWVERMGYRANRLEFRDYALGEDDAVALILGPTTEITPAHARDTLEWVAQGGTLVLASEASSLFGSGNALFDELGVELAVYTDTTTIERARPRQPVFDAPAVGSARVQASRILIPHRNDYAPLLGVSDALVALGIRHGQGYVYLVSSVYPFTNEGLADEQNARFVLNMLRRAPANARVVFDEYHHGYIRPPTTTTALVGNPFGWTWIYIACAVAMYLLLSGRRFGRPIPLKEEVQRRSSAEYVQSMADLFQRGGKVLFVGKHYHSQFKRRLARPFGVSPQLDDATFVDELRHTGSLADGDLQQVRSVLNRLDTLRDDGMLMRAVADADAFLAKLQTRR